MSDHFNTRTDAVVHHELCQQQDNPRVKARFDTAVAGPAAPNLGAGLKVLQRKLNSLTAEQQIVWSE